MKGRAAAEVIFREGVHAVQPEQLIRKEVAIPSGTFDHIYVTGAGKATAAMAWSLEHMLGDRISGGVIAAKHGHGLPLRMIRHISESHPVTDEQGLKAAEAIGALADQAGKKDLVICLFSGGASALIADCPEGITLKELQETSGLLLRSGADIAEINTVRKHLSTLKGGQLARRAEPARVMALLISDVVGDDPGTIASGPVTADASTFEDAWQVIERYDLAQRIPSAIRRRLEKGRLGQVPETPKPGDDFFANVRTHIMGNNRTALAAAAEKAFELGYHARVLGTEAVGPAEDLAVYLVKEARS